MRLVSKISFIAILLTSTGGLLLAQHTGSGVGHTTGGHSWSNSVHPTTFGSHSAAVPPTLPNPVGAQPQVSGLIGITPGGPYSGNYGRGYGYGYGRGVNRAGRNYGYLVAPYYPLYSYGYGDGYQGDFSYGPAEDLNAQNAQVSANLLGDQIERLSAEVAELREERQGGPYPMGPYAPMSQMNQAPPQGDPAPAVTPVTVVLQSGQKLQVQSYAVMDKTFWDFSKEPARRIPVANIDVAASIKATEDAGGEFPEIAQAR